MIPQNYVELSDEKDIKALLNVYGVSDYKNGIGSFNENVAIHIDNDSIKFRLNEISENFVDELTKIFRDYGEEKFAYKIACNIVKQREKGRIETTLQLADIIAVSYPAAARRDGNPARKCFQAIRIAVNDEFGSLERALDSAFDLLNKDGVLSIITFHSLEDRIVKQRFKEYCTGCICPPDFPVCVCGKKPRGKLLFRKPITASSDELENNLRSRSAKLRSIIKL